MCACITNALLFPWLDLNASQRLPARLNLLPYSPGVGQAYPIVSTTRR